MRCILGLLCLIVSPLLANAQHFQYKNFWKVKDTLYVRGPAVVGYMMPDTMMDRLWKEGGKEEGNDDFGWYVGKCEELLDSLHIPNAFDDSRFVRIVSTKKSRLIDRSKLPPTILSTTLLISRSGGWKKEAALIIQDSAAIAETKRYLR